MNINIILSIKEQEDFMHLIYDVIHNGIDLCNLEYTLENMQLRYGNLTNILNSRMKNERYSNSYDIPIMKIILETKSYICNNIPHNDFLNKKISAIKLLQKYGATLNIYNEKYIDHIPYWNIILQKKEISEEIFNLIKEPFKNIITI
jgi:hypothetical protein